MEKCGHTTFFWWMVAFLDRSLCYWNNAQIYRFARDAPLSLLIASVIVAIVAIPTCDRRRRRQADRERRRKRVQPAQARQGAGRRSDHDPFPFRRRRWVRLLRGRPAGAGRRHPAVQALGGVRAFQRGGPEGSLGADAQNDCGLVADGVSEFDGIARGPRRRDHSGGVAKSSPAVAAVYADRLIATLSVK